MSVKTIFIVVIIALNIFTCRDVEQGGNSLSATEFIINLDHLNHLSESITLDSTEVLIVYIYADAPSYKPIEAAGEGITAVDDVARAVLVYLKYYEQFGGDENLDKAEKALRFVLSMQANDGQFYNFIFDDYSINRSGRTSLKSFDYWAVRAIRALAYGYKVFSQSDPAFADSLKQSIELTYPHIERWLGNYGNYNLRSPVNIPAWLINEAGDQSSELVLGLLDYFEVTGDETVKEYIRKLTDGLVRFQIHKGDYAGAHLAWQNIWHGWGAHQVQAIARAYKIFNDEKWLTSVDEGALFLSNVVSEGFLNEIKFIDADSAVVLKFPQIAYGAHTITSGLMEAYLVTNNEEYKVNMKAALKWLSGKNDANTVMYDNTTGRTFDGIDENGVNKNSGAESTIESLLLLLELKENNLL